MKRIDDEQVWFQAQLDTPFGAPQARVDRAHARREPDDLLDCPGVCLKARHEKINGFRLTGKLVSHSDDEVVVRSRPEPFNGNLKCVWRGDPASYARMWTVD